jgi:hypothetical protein
VTPANILILTFAGLTLGLFAFFWGVSLFLQSAIYNGPTTKLAIRSAIGAILVSGFLTFWTYANTRAESKDRYGTFFEFNPTTSVEFSEFTAVRQNASKKESTAEYKKQSGRYVEVENITKQFQQSTSDYFVVAFEMKEGDKKVRYDVQLDPDGKLPRGTRILKEAGGRRFIEMSPTNSLSPIYAPSRGAAFAALGLNLLHFVVWFLVFWPVLRYTVGHSIGGAAGLGLFTMLLIMPLLFEKNKVPDAFKPLIAAAPK